MDTNTKKTLGLILTILGTIAGIFCIIKINNELNLFIGGYTYTAPFTPHEIYMILATIAAVCSIIIGCILLFIKNE